MLINQVTICNYKSYRELTSLDNLTAGLTTFIGRNGSGKTNLCDAIECILGQGYRGKKFARGFSFASVVSPRSTEGFIQIVFSDCQPLFNGDITIKLAFFIHKKCCFYINDKKVTSREFTKFLQCTGYLFYQPFILNSQLVRNFSRLTPDLILNFTLKNLGPIFYEIFLRVQDSLKKLEDGKNMLHSFRELLPVILTSVSEIHIAQMNELKKKKLSVICGLHTKRIALWEKKKSMLEKILEEGDGDKSYDISNFDSEIEEQLTAIDSHISTLKSSLNDLENEEMELIKKKEKNDLKLADLQENLRSIQEDLSGEEGDLEEKAQSLQGLLQESKKKLHEQNLISFKYGARIDELEQKRSLLLEKIRRPQEYQNINTRKHLLDNIIRSVDKRVKFIEDGLVKLMNESDETVQRKGKLLKERVETQESRMSADKLSDAIKRQGLRLKDLQNRVSDLRRKENVLLESVNSKNEEKLSIQRKLIKKFGRNVIEGINSVKDCPITREFSEAGKFFGPVIDNFKCPPGLNIAIENVLGSRLLSLIVENHSVGNEILKEMNSSARPGEVWFIPIHGIQIPHFQLPTNGNGHEDADAEPLLSLLQYSPEVENVMRFLFGRIMVCRNIDVATRIARNVRATCVTPEGDTVSGLGVITGGFFDPKNSSIKTYKEAEEISRSLGEKEDKLKIIQQTLHLAETDVVNCSSDIEKDKNRLYHLCRQGKANNCTLDDKLKAVDDRIEAIERDISEKSIYIKELTNFKESLEADKGKSQSIDELNNELTALNKTIGKIEKLQYESIEKLRTYEQEGVYFENKLLINRKIKKSGELKLRALSECTAKVKNAENVGFMLTHRLLTVQKRMDQIRKDLTEAEKNRETFVEVKKDYMDACLQKYLESEKSRENNLKSKIAVYDEKINKSHGLILNLRKKYNSSVYFEDLDLNRISIRELREENQRINEEIKTLLEMLNGRGTNGHSPEVIYSEKFRFLEAHLSSAEKYIMRIAKSGERFVMTGLERVAENFGECLSRLYPGTPAVLLAEDDSSSRYAPLLPDITGLYILPEECQSLRDLSLGQKARILLALAAAIAKTSPRNLLVIDEGDSALNLEERRNLYRFLESELPSTQVFASAHSAAVVLPQRPVFNVLSEHGISTIKPQMSQET